MFSAGATIRHRNGAVTGVGTLRSPDGSRVRFGVDITQRTLAEEQLAESEDVLSRYFRQAQSPSAWRPLRVA